MSTNNAIHDLPFFCGADQPVVESVIAIAESLRIEARQVQNRCLQVLNTNRVFAVPDHPGRFQQASLSQILLSSASVNASDALFPENAEGSRLVRQLTANSRQCSVI